MGFAHKVITTSNTYLFKALNHYWNTHVLIVVFNLYLVLSFICVFCVFFYSFYIFIIRGVSICKHWD